MSEASFHASSWPPLLRTQCRTTPSARNVSYARENAERGRIVTDYFKARQVLVTTYGWASKSFRAAIPQSTDKEMRRFLISLGLEAKIFHNGRYTAGGQSRLGVDPSDRAAH
jgi:hypothetical protein